MNKLKKKIIFEGADKSGKSSLAKELRLIYPDLDIADRSFISDRVYANKFNRTQYLGVDINTYLSYWEQFHANALDTSIILCVADKDTLAMRAIQHEEPFCRNRNYNQIKDFLEKDQIAFCNTTKAISLLYNFKVLEIDTSLLRKDECITKIKGFIDNDR